jgi:hypothetical protein
MTIDWALARVTISSATSFGVECVQLNTLCRRLSDCRCACLVGQGEHGVAHELLAERRCFKACKLIQRLRRFDRLHQRVHVGGLDLSFPVVDE